MTKLVIISDTHRLEHHIDLPEGDILVHCGDFSNHGSEQEFNNFCNWVAGLKYNNVVISPGNHDIYVESNPAIAKAAINNSNPNAKLYIHEPFTIDGIKFFASPYTPRFYDWAFNVARNSETAINNWAQIPDDTEVLITHGPPFGTRDLAYNGGLSIMNVGCEALSDRIKQLKQLRIHAFGHIHLGYGLTTKDDVIYINAAQLNDDHQIANTPIIISV